MRSHQVVSAVIAAVIAAGCATTGDSGSEFQPKTHHCDGDCDVDVSYWTGPPERVEVRNGRGKKISWKFRGAGQFEPPGIVFVNNQGPSGRPVFTNCRLSESDKKVTCDNSGEVGREGDYKYNVLIDWRRDIDPWVINK